MLAARSRVIWLIIVTSQLSSSPAPAADVPAGIEGVVADGGTPVAGALVAAVPTPDVKYDPQTTRSDADGRFRFTLAPGKYAITATAGGHTAGFVGSLVVEPRAITRTHVDLGGDAVDLEGHVVDADDGKPLDGRVVAARSSDVDGDQFVVDVVHGNYKARLPRARYSLIVRAPGHVDRNASASADAPSATHRLLRTWPSGPAPAEVVDWLRARATPLATVAPENGYDDLRPLAASLGGARIVGLGEATHGTRDFFQLKHRLLEWLVAEQGFTTFAIEASMPECFAIDEYVQTGRGDPRRLINGMHFWTWDTEEVLALVQWMRKWNEDPTHKRVRFYGFDMQFAPRAREAVLRYIARVAPAEAPRLAATLAQLRYQLDAGVITALPADSQRALVAAVETLVVRFDSERQRWSAKSSPDAWAMARQHARVLEQFIHATFHTDATREERDRAMAENLVWIADHEGPSAKIVAWAHNSHISRTDLWGWTPMGGYLSQQLGNAYVPVGFSFGRGSFRAQDRDHDDKLRTITVEPLAVGAFDETLLRTGLPRLIIDLRAPATAVVRDWLHAAHARRNYGPSYSTKWPMLSMAVSAEFDLVAFVADTTASRPLNATSGRLPERQAQLVNGSFEDVDASGVPRGWARPGAQPAPAYEVATSTRAPLDGGRCLHIGRENEKAAGNVRDEEYAALQQLLDARSFVGTRLTLTFSARTELRPGAPGARAYLRVDGPFSLLTAATMREAPIVKRAWSQYQVSVDVPARATQIWVGLALMGAGTACFDALRLDAAVPPPH